MREKGYNMRYITESPNRISCESAGFLIAWASLESDGTWTLKQTNPYGPDKTWGNLTRQEVLDRLNPDDDPNGTQRR